MYNGNRARMTTTGHWVTEAIASLGLGDRVRVLGRSECEAVLAEITAALLEVPSATFWWSHLKMPSSSWPTENGYRFIPEIVPTPESPAWFISGLTDDEKSVFECAPALVPAIIGECPCFEYAVVDRQLKWIVIENHHDVVIAAGPSAVERLDRLRQ